MDKMPKWADVVLVPVVSLILAALISIIVFMAVGQNPWEALKLMAYGAVGTSDSLGYTLFYTTNFIFTGLAVAVAFHASLFNIGGEGQVLLGGLGAAIVCLFVPWPHWTLALIGGGLAAAQQSCSISWPLAFWFTCSLMRCAQMAKCKPQPTSSLMLHICHPSTILRVCLGLNCLAAHP